jgi:hypothetical protein
MEAPSAAMEAPSSPSESGNGDDDVFYTPRLPRKGDFIAVSSVDGHLNSAALRPALTYKSGNVGAPCISSAKSVFLGIGSISILGLVVFLATTVAPTHNSITGAADHLASDGAPPAPPCAHQRHLSGMRRCRQHRHHLSFPTLRHRHRLHRTGFACSTFGF